MKLPLIRATLIAATFLVFSQVRGSDVGRITHTYNGDMTIDQAVQIALKQNPDVLRALQQIELTRGQIIEVRAQALPHIILNASYNQLDPALVQSSSSSSSVSPTASLTSNQIANIGGISQNSAQQIATALSNSTSGATGSSTSFGTNDKSWIVTVQATQVSVCGQSDRGGDQDCEIHGRQQLFQPAEYRGSDDRYGAPAVLYGAARPRAHQSPGGSASVAGVTELGKDQQNSVRGGNGAAL